MRSGDWLLLLSISGLCSTVAAGWFLAILTYVAFFS